MDGGIQTQAPARLLMQPRNASGMSQGYLINTSAGFICCKLQLPNVVLRLQCPTNMVAAGDTT